MPQETSKGGVIVADLVLELSVKAREKFSKWDGEGHIEITRIGSG